MQEISKGIRKGSIVAASALALLLAACKPEPVPVDDVRAVRTLTIGASATAATNIYAGEVRPRYESALGFRVGGKLISREVDVGERVKQGQVLARLDLKDLDLQRQAADAQIAAAVAQKTNAADDLARVRSLQTKGYASQGELDRFLSQFQVAEAQLKAIQAQGRQAANQTGYGVLTADADGVVTAVLAESGQVVAAGQVVVQLARDGAVEVAAAVPEDRINTVREGMAVEVSLWSDAGKTYPGEIREVSSAADPLTRTYAVRVSVPKPPPQMKLRMTASVAIPLPNLPDLVHLPAPAMVTQQGKAGVWVVEPKESLVRFRAVEFAGVEGNELLVAAGLAKGEQVVTAGAAYLREGQKVRLLGAPPAAVPAPAATAAPATAG